MNCLIGFFKQSIEPNRARKQGRVFWQKVYHLHNVLHKKRASLNKENRK